MRSVVTIGEYSVEKVVELERPFAHAQEFFPDLTAEMLETCRRELPGRLTDDDGVPPGLPPVGHKLHRRAG